MGSSGKGFIHRNRIIAVRPRHSEILPREPQIYSVRGEPDGITDMTTSHSTRLSKDDNLVAGYNPAKGFA